MRIRRKLFKKVRNDPGSKRVDKETLGLLQENDIFDPVWYLRKYTDVQDSGWDPFEHYCEHGYAEHRDPNALFSCAYYLHKHNDVDKAGMHPVFHFLKHGSEENRCTHPYISPQYLKHRLLISGTNVVNILTAFKRTKEELVPRPLFDYELLQSIFSDRGKERLSSWELLREFRLQNDIEEISPNFLFSIDFVHNQAPSSLPALEKYLSTLGGSVSPHMLFDLEHVHSQLKNHSYQYEDFTLLDRVMYLAQDDIFISPHILFDNEKYLSSRQKTGHDGIKEGRHPCLDYLGGGWKSGGLVNNWFSSIEYADRYMTDAEIEVQSPLEHYVANGRSPHITHLHGFQQKVYSTRYPEVLKHFPRTPLEHFISHGLLEGRSPSTDELWRDQFSSWQELREFIDEKQQNRQKNPVVSIIIPVYNNFEYTLRSIFSILIAGDIDNIEIILIDDCSDDETSNFFSGISGIRYVRNEENLGYLKSCNKAAELAKGKYLYLLNNDTAVTYGFMSTLLRTIEADSDVGLVGSKFIYPDGSLQESGGFVWKNGGGANIGRNDDPEEPGYSYLRDTDYVSGAGILLSKELWDFLGGYSEEYLPAYCEDSDLAMQIRQHGYRVVIQPLSRVVHYEGITCGRSLSSGIKSYQKTNQERLEKKWSFALELHESSHVINPRQLRTGKRPRILIIDHIIPEPDKDAGSVTAFYFMRLLIEMGYEVTFIPDNLIKNDRYAEALQEIGVEVLYGTYVSSISGYIAEYGHCFELFILFRVNSGGRYMNDIKQNYPHKPVIFYTVDLHYLRESRKNKLSKNSDDATDSSANTKSKELDLIRRSTETVLLSDIERNELINESVKEQKLSVMPLILECVDQKYSRPGRDGIAFVGGFQHEPNVDAVLYFVEEVFPILRKIVPSLKFHVVGSNPSSEILNIKDDNIIVHGYVEDLDHFLSQRVMTIAPLRYGAGVKGKIASSLAVGVPVVASTLAIEGMGLEPESNVLVADSAESFSEEIVRLLRNDDLWRKLSESGVNFIQKNYSLDNAKNKINELLLKVNAPPYRGYCPIEGEIETRRYLHSDNPDSLASGYTGSWSSERVLASRILSYLGTSTCSLSDLTAKELSENGDGVSLFGDLPRLRDVCERLNIIKDAPGLACIRLPLEGEYMNTLGGFLSSVGRECNYLEVACVCRDDKNAQRIRVIVEELLDQGWQVRTQREPLAECVFTKCLLISCKR